MVPSGSRSAHGMSPLAIRFRKSSSARKLRSRASFGSATISSISGSSRTLVRKWATMNVVPPPRSRARPIPVLIGSGARIRMIPIATTSSDANRTQSSHQRRLRPRLAADAIASITSAGMMARRDVPAGCLRNVMKPSRILTNSAGRRDNCSCIWGYGLGPMGAVFNSERPRSRVQIRCVGWHGVVENFANLRTTRAPPARIIPFGRGVNFS